LFIADCQLPTSFSMESLPDKSLILIVDDDAGLLMSIRATLLIAGIPEPALVSDSRMVMDLLRRHDFHLALLDLIMPHISGMELLKQIKQEHPSIESIVITAVDEVSSAVSAMRYGAYDYLVKPLQAENLLMTMNNALERYHLRQGISVPTERQGFAALKNPGAFRDMVAEDETMAMIFHLAETAAATDYNLLITGETGTGKEMLARILHELSHRSSATFVPINMSTLSKTLFEDELFGHAKGAFTGAIGERKGFFEAAEGGTIFLDEIADLDLPMQGKLLRLIEERELYRLGSTVVRNVDVRVIAATNRDIRKETREGRFREDLFYRLGTFHINIPPLRERRGDILPLAKHFLNVHAKKNRKEIHSIAPDLCDALMAYSFPGNVRELENIMASAVLFEKGRVLNLSSANNLAPFSGPSSNRAEWPVTLAELEKTHIHKVLEATAGNRTRAAKVLKIGVRTLQRKLREESGGNQ
jgi:DNA-binding NtrC family response regulator